MNRKERRAAKKQSESVQARLPPERATITGAAATTAQLFAAGLDHHRAGRLAEGEALYRRILASDPNHVDSLHLLGVMAHQADRPEIAVELIRKALALRPNFAEA